MGIKEKLQELGLPLEFADGNFAATINLIDVEEAKKIKIKLEKEELSFKVRVGAQDKVFGRISPKQIKEELDKLGYNIDKKQISNAENASSLGYHNVEVILYKDVIANLRIKLEK